MPSTNTTFKPKNVVKKLLAVLPDRARDVIISRYGLGKSTDKLTLDAIGKKYGITRERVRQIEDDVFRKARESKRLRSLLRSFLPSGDD